MKNVKNEMISTQSRKERRDRKAFAHFASFAARTLRAAAGALWLLWVLPGILVAACSASAEEEADARLKAVDGGAAR